LGWEIFVQSLRQVFDNLHVALRISLVLYLIHTVVSIGFGQSLANEFSMMGPGQMPDGGSVLAAMASAILTVILFTWIAVSWHRFILLGEVPTSFVPIWRGGSILRYIVMSVIIALLLALLSLAVSFVLGMILIPIGGMMGATLLGFILVVIVAIVGYRLSIVLPSIAIGKTITLSQALQSTSGQGGTLLFLGFVAGAASFIIQLPAVYSPDPNSLLNQIYVLVVGWFTLMIGVSILSTLYQIFVEGNRPS